MAFSFSQKAIHVYLSFTNLANVCPSTSLHPTFCLHITCSHVLSCIQFCPQYPTIEGDADVVMHFPQDGLRQGVTRKVLEAAEAAIAQKGAFTLVLSGGSLPNLLTALADPKLVRHVLILQACAHRCVGVFQVSSGRQH